MDREGVKVRVWVEGNITRHEVVVHGVVVHLPLLVQRVGGLPEQLLELPQGVPPLRLVFRLEFWNPLLQNNF